MSNENKVVKISPSLMCANPKKLFKQIEELHNAKVDYLHFDIMDGRFVPNKGLEPSIYAYVSKTSDIPIELHLLVNFPEKYIGSLSLRKKDIFIFHYESKSKFNIFDLIKKAKKQSNVGIAINPGTMINKVYPYLSTLNTILIMGVQPGFRGLQLIKGTHKKIKTLLNIKNKLKLTSLDIEIDGGVNFHTLKRLARMELDKIVCGKVLFDTGQDVEKSVANLRKILLEV